MKLLTLDFETRAIQPDTPYPEPVSFAAITSTGRTVSCGWGHPEGNSCDRRFATETLTRLLRNHDALLMFNAGFDLRVMRHLDVGRFDLPFHDVQILAFLADPYATQLRLKPLAEKYLGEAPEEAHAAQDWLIEHKVVRRTATRQWGAFISAAPWEIVRPYAEGDVRRTLGLWKHWRALADGEAYRREIATLRCTLQMEDRGVCLDSERLAKDVAHYETVLARTQGRIRKALGVGAEFDLEKRVAVADAIETRYGIELPLTDKGNRRTSKDVLLDVIPDPSVKALMRYEGALRYDLKNYLRPWIGKDVIHVMWHTTRSDDGGARTGRLSSSPNFQNLKSAEGEDRLVTALKALDPRAPVDLPRIRSYVVPPRGQVVVGADYSQIELRLTAHYEDGVMAAGYRANPEWDLHQFVVDAARERFRRELRRVQAKGIGFGIIYGSGAPGVAATLGVSVEEGRAMRDLYLATLPGLQALMDDVRDRGRHGGTVTTLGGRRYKAEPGRHIDGEFRTFEYKLLNYLIQGSAADLMKEAMCVAHANGLDIRLSVHDEPVCYAPAADAQHVAMQLIEAMVRNDVALRVDVPVLANSYIVSGNWAEAEK